MSQRLAWLLQTCPLPLGRGPCVPNTWAFLQLLRCVLLMCARCRPFLQSPFPPPPLCCSAQFSSAAQSCPILRDPMDCSTPGIPVHHQLPELAQTHVHRVSDAPAFNLSQHQGLFQGVRSSHQLAKVLEFQLQHQSFQGTLRTDLL